MNLLCEKAVSYLQGVYDNSNALFPFTVALHNGSYVPAFDHPSALRYTVNSLLGMKRAAGYHSDVAFFDDLPLMIDRFLSRHYSRLSNYADRGLLLLLLSDSPDEKTTRELLRDIDEATRSSSLSRFDIQDLAWMLWGAVSAAKHSMNGAADVARRLFRLLHDHFFCQESFLPRHSLSFHRKNLTSFGGVAYFLRCLYEYASLFEDERVLTLFESGVQRMIDVRGPQGEWPWMISVTTGKPLDFYPVYSVHQDAMAMLFLFPAMEIGIPEAKEAVESSFLWILGNNQLDRPMLVLDPFFVFRCIQRRGGFGKQRRYMRSIAHLLTHRPASICPNTVVEVNPECRSYHIGWMLYVWCDRNDFPEFTQLEGVQALSEPADYPMGGRRE